MASGAAIASPCIQVCRIDPQSDQCVGCRRSLAEIAAWARLSDAQRAAIMHDLPNRPAPIVKATD